jgi:hypothetical protein
LTEVIDFVPSTRFYLDTHQWTYCVEPSLPGWTSAGLADLRAAMIQAVNDGRAICVGSQFHLQEISGIPRQYRIPILQFFWEVVRWSLLKPTAELVEAEVAAGRALVGNEAYATFREQQSIKVLTLKSAKFDELAKDIAVLNAKTSKQMQNAREDVQVDLAAKYPGFSPEQITKQWFNDPEAVLKSWADDYLDGAKERFHLPDDRSLWPNPANLPTIRAVMFSNLARIYLQNLEHRKISEGDAHDSHHYAAACYADVFVTEDAAFKKVLEIIHATVSVRGFNEFAAIMNTPPH